LKAFWKVIFPVPVTLNLFFALEFVFTFGIINNQNDYTLLAFRTDGNLWSLVGNVCFIINSDTFYKAAAKVGKNSRKRSSKAS
jgi:hypothetical protein